MHSEAAQSFHFLRPLWLIALLSVAAFVYCIRYLQRADVQWGNLISPHLLEHLILRPKSAARLQPVYIVALGLVFAILALAGPAWQRERPPFVEDKAPLMIVLAVTPTMMHQDVAPSRLERAKQKIGDLLKARAGARSGLIAYAGTAHLVMPLTDDRTVIAPFLGALSPSMMPAEGNNLVAAVTLAAQSLALESIPGTVLIVSDTVAKTSEKDLLKAAGRNSIAILSVLPPKSTEPQLSDAVRVSVDDSDLRALERRIETHFQVAQTDKFGTRWHDEGYWLLLPAALLSLLWFRRGTTVAWAVVFFVLLHGQPARAEDTSTFRDLWLTRDQQGRLAFDRGDYIVAKTLFIDPMWQGLAAYRAFDFLTAAEAFSKVDTSEGRFALGNAQAQNHAYEKAIKAYDDVLKAEPDNTSAKTNRAIVIAALNAREAKRRKQEEGEAPPDEKADETRVDPSQKGGKRVEVTPLDVTTAGSAEAWMREVQTKPADFLKLKFAIQAASTTPKATPR